MLKLKDKYKKEVVPLLMAKFSWKSPLAAPGIQKVVVNTGFGREAVVKTGEEQKKFQESILESLSLICGQKAVLTSAKKSISSFKLRKGMAIGAKVTLRGQKMYDFLERVINIVLPRSRDFKGLEPKSVDGRGNLTFAIKEQIAFPEVSAEKARQIFGLEITVATNAADREKGLELLKAMGFPIKS